MKKPSKLRVKQLSLLMLPFGLLSGYSSPTFSQKVLPFPTTPTASIAKETLGESTHKRRVEPARLPADAPNILIVLMDDVGPGTPSSYGGLVNTPNLSRVANQGISYNQFHSTAMSSPTRAALLTGRNHTKVENGQITELSNDFDGFSGVIPKTAATLPEVLKNYGYSTAAFGKWHNTPALDTTKAGPFDFWPTGYGFEYFYGFLAGETSQYEPMLIKNTTYVDLPKSAHEGYHLTDDLASNAIGWMRDQKAIHPDKPLFMYWAPGAAHGPHHVDKKWADKYKGKFDGGWDKYREVVFDRQKKLGFIPKDAQLTARPDTMPAWDSIPEDQRAFQSRLMEVFAGFAEHADYNVGLMLDEIERLGMKDNTLVFYIWGDNGSSSEGQSGTISELLAQNQIPTKVEDHIRILNDELGGLDALGTDKTDNMYHSGWAWAGSTPFKATKLTAAFFGGTRQPMAVSWPKEIKPDKQMHSQFHHVNDITPTVYDILKITPPEVVNGFKQMPMDGTSMKYSFNNGKAPDQKKTQFFDIMGSRAIYHDGWIASTFGPRIPWLTVTPGMATWTPDKDVWELYNLKEDFTQANDLAKKYPSKLEDLKAMFMDESRKNKNLPIGAGLYTAFHPDEVIANPAKEFNYSSLITRMPEFTAPRIASRSNHITLDLKNTQDANGVLFALGGYAGGMSVYLENGVLTYEYNLFHVERTKLKSSTKLPVGDAKVEIIMNTKPFSEEKNNTLLSGDVTILVNGKQVAQGTVPRLVSFGFTTNEAFDMGSDLGSPVSNAYYAKAPFKYDGEIRNMHIKYTN